MAPQAQAQTDTAETMAPAAGSWAAWDEPATDHPDFQGLACTAEELLKDWDDHEAGRTESIPWEEVKREAHALYG